MKRLEIVVCVKQVPDPEGPAEAFRVDTVAKKVVPEGISPVINPFDENALEAALLIKDRLEARVTVLTMGEKLAQPVLRKALAAGADELIMLMDEQFKNLDSYSTAYVLSTAIRRLESFDIIFTGRQAGDWDFGVTGLMIAESLSIPVINLARRVEIRDGTVYAEKLCDGGYRIVKTRMPVLVTASGEIGELRYPNVRALVDAKKRPVEILRAEDLGLDTARLRPRTIADMFAFQGQRRCTFLEGESAEDKAENLVTLIRKEGII